MESWDSSDCITQQFFDSHKELELDDCITQQLTQQMTTKIDGTIKKKYFPNSASDMDIEQFNVYQHITKRDYEDQSLSELQCFSKMFRCAKYQIEHGLESLDNSLETKDACETRFQSTFHTLKDYCIEKPTKCCLLNPSRENYWEGECYICHDFFCFAINNPELDCFAAPLKISIPYADIMAITKAGRKYHHDHINGKRPGKQYSPFTVIPLSGCRVKPSVIQIWTSEKQVHQFFGFAGHYDMVFTHVYDNWRAIQVEDKHKQPLISPM